MSLAAAALALVGLATAPPPQWTAPPQCPTQAEVLGWVSALMLDARSPVPAWQGTIEEPTPGHYALQLSLPDQARVLEGTDCVELGKAAALVVAVAADPVAVVGVLETPVQHPAPPPSPEPDPEPETELEPAPRRSVEPAPPPNPAPRARSRPSGHLWAAVGAELAVLPRPGIGGALGGGVAWPHARIELLGLFSNPRRIEGEDAGLGARAMVVGGQLRGCGVLVSPTLPVEVPLCAAMEVGGMWARGYGPGIEPLPKTQPWAALVPSVGITGWFGRRLGIEARVSAPIGLYQPAVHLEGADEVSVFRAGAVGARAWLGPVLRFP